MIIREKIDSIDFDIEFNDKDKFHLFIGQNGTGKTFMCKTLNKYLNENGVGAVFINSSIVAKLDSESIKDMCIKNDKEFVILDNADLYLTQDLIDALSATNKKIIICIKRLHNLRLQNLGTYRVMYENTSFAVKRNL